MARPYVVGGPKRFRHQVQGLRKMIETRGVCGLLFDPGCGKTAVALDYAGLLALKSPTGEARVLVVAPLVAVDTWVSQTATFLTPDVDYWAEAVGGGLLQRAETLAARGGNPYTHPLGQPRSIPAAPRPLGEGAGTFEREAHAKAQRVHDTARRAHQRFQREARKGAPHHRKAIALGARRRDGQRVDYSRGPSQLSYPRLIIEVVNIDTFASRSEVGSKTMADVMLDAVHRYSPDLVIVDESHKIKGPSANASRLLARIARSVPRRVILTGTVMPHSPMDVFAQWRFLDPHAFGDGSREATFGGYKNRYAIMGGWMGKEVKGFCNTPDAPIWMRDGSFKPLGEVKPGDSLMGWDQESTAHVKGGARRSFVESTVLAVSRRIATNVAEVTLSSGRKIKCTRDHKWLRYNTKDRKDVWATVEEEPYHLNRGFSVGLSRVVEVPERLSATEQRSADWLAGLYDGEGSAETICQSLDHNPEVCQRIEEELTTLGIPYGVTRSPRGFLTYRFKGGHQTYVNILNQWPIARRGSLEKMIQWSRRNPGEPKRMHRTREHVVSIRDLPPQEVVSMQTTTGNYVAWGLASRNCRLDEMQDIMARNSIVARKEDALDLPPTQDVVIPVHLSAGEKRAYEDLRSDLATQLADGSLVSTPNRLVQMMRLRQVTSGHLPDDDTGTVQVIGKSKVQTIASLVNDTLAGEKRVVVFALFSKEIEMLSEALATSGTEVMAVTGHTPVSEREGLRRRFGSKDPQRMVMIAQIKTMSLAVNELVTANHAVFASLSQQRDDMVQARDRLNRIGQERPVTFWYALAPGTVDAVIMRSHRDRTDLESACLAHIQNQGEGIAR